MIGFLRRPAVHDFRDGNAVMERMTMPHGSAAFVLRRVRRGDVLKMWDGDWKVEQAVNQGDSVFLCRISKLPTRVAA